MFVAAGRCECCIGLPFDEFLTYVDKVLFLNRLHQASRRVAWGEAIRGAETLARLLRDEIDFPCFTNLAASSFLAVRIIFSIIKCAEP